MIGNLTKEKFLKIKSMKASAKKNPDKNLIALSKSCEKMSFKDSVDKRDNMFVTITDMQYNSNINVSSDRPLANPTGTKTNSDKENPCENQFPKHLENPSNPRLNIIDQKKIKWYGVVSDFPNIKDEIKMGSSLGKGSFASVYNGYDKKLDKDVAVKVYLKKNQIPRERKEFVQNEIDVMSRIDQDGIVKYIRTIEDDKCVIFLYKTIDLYCSRKMRGKILERICQRVQE